MSRYTIVNKEKAIILLHNIYLCSDDVVFLKILKQINRFDKDFIFLEDKGEVVSIYNIPHNLKRDEILLHVDVIANNLEEKYNKLLVQIKFFVLLFNTINSTKE